MAFIGGVFLRTVQTVLRVIELLASILILAIFSYFLAVLKDHGLTIAMSLKAVEGMSGAAVLYCIFAVLLTFFLGGNRFFAFLAIILDLCFVGCNVAIAVINKGGADSCTGTVNTPLGKGNAGTGKSGSGYGEDGFGFGKGKNVTYAPNLRQSCKLTKAVFAIAIVNIILFLVTALMQFAVARHHQRDKRYGPSPSNNYTSGRRFRFGRKKQHNVRDAEMATAGRPSGETGYTGETMVQDGTGYGHKPAPAQNGQFYTANHQHY